MSIRVGPGWISGAVAVGVPGFGVLGSVIAANDEAIIAAGGKAGYLYNDLSMPADANKEICGRITRWPATGTLLVYHGGQFFFTPAADGAESFEYQLYVDGVATGSPETVTLVSGSAAITLTGANATQTNAGNVGAISQAHVLVGSASTQANSGSTGGIGQTHMLAGANASQVNAGSTGAIGGSIVLSGAAGSQANTASTAAITQTHVLAGSASVQANAAPGGAITQTHVLAGANSTQTNLGSTASLGEVTLTLTGAAGSQSNSATSGAISQTHKLVAAPSVQDNIASASAIVQMHMLAAANAVQANVASTGAIVIAGAAHWPTPDQVLAGVTYGPTGADYTGTATGGSGLTAEEIAAAVRTELAAELQQLTKVSKIHGVGVPLVVTSSQRQAGDLVQTITTVGDTTTVSAA